MSKFDDTLVDRPVIEMLSDCNLEEKLAMNYWFENCFPFLSLALWEHFLLWSRMIIMFFVEQKIVSWQNISWFSLCEKLTLQLGSWKKVNAIILLWFTNSVCNGLKTLCKTRAIFCPCSAKTKSNLKSGILASNCLYGRKCSSSSFPTLKSLFLPVLLSNQVMSVLSAVRCSP